MEPIQMDLSPAIMERFQPNYSYMFKFEEKFMHQDTREWMTNHWIDSVYFGFIYAALIYIGRQWMSNRPKYELRGLLAAWNIGLAVFSIMGVVRTFPELYHVLTNYGFYHSVCVPSFMYSRVCGCWVWLFALSKLPELGDTFFIVLRKQKLIFLHWYHHMTVLMYAWFSYSEYSAPARWFVVINFSVHALMYTYYALKAMRFSPPQGIAMLITGLQITQMIFNFGITIYVYRIHSSNDECNVTMNNIWASSIIYTSYFVLFAKFFHEAYFSKKAKNLHKSENNGNVSKEYSNNKLKSN